MSLRERLIREGIDRSAAVVAEYYARLGARNFAKQLIEYAATPTHNTIGLLSFFQLL